MRFKQFLLEGFKEIDNSKGQRGFGNRIFEMIINGDKLIVVKSKYSSSMKRGSALNGSINIIYKKSNIDKSFSGKDMDDKANKFLNKNFNVNMPI